MTEFKTFAVIGAGAFGTALAETSARAGRTVRLWARNPDLVTELQNKRTNATYLPGVTLSTGIVVTSDFAAALRDADLVMLATPAQSTRDMATQIAPLLKPRTPIVLCAKGIELATGKLLAEVLAEAAPQATPAVLSGPSFAADVVRGLPVAVTLATADKALGADLCAGVAWKGFRPYWTDDLTGVQIGGAVKNVLAIAAGILDGRKLGASAHAALVARGFAELRRYALAHGARPETLMGLSGLGDLVLTCGSPQSRNMSLGRALGEGRTLADILGGRKAVSEGVATASAVAQVARRLGLSMPISAAVASIVDGEATVDAAIDALLSRPLKAED